MRPFAAALMILALPGPLAAEDFVVSSRVTAATVFPQGATLTRVATVSVPAGRHRILVQDMPVIDPAALRVAAPGLTVGPIRYRDDYVPPRDPAETAALEAAREEVRARERAVEAARDAVAAIRIEADAARARIAFLDGIGQSDGLAQADPERLRDLVALIGEVGLEARRAVQAAETRARAAEQDVKDALEDLAKAQQALKALDTEAQDRAFLAIEVQAETAAEGAMTLTYSTGSASWQPTYDLRLTTGEAPDLMIGRGAYVRQSTGDNWTDIALTLSTVQPSGQQVPGEVWPWLRQIFDPGQPPMPAPLVRGSASMASEMATKDMASPVAEEVQAAASFDGLSVTYSYPDPVSVATAADAVKIALGEISLEPEIFARAVPLADRTAFLNAGFTNNSGELILGTGDARFFLDGTFVGQRHLDLIAEGDDAEISFGPIEGLRLERVVRDRQQGDRGVITRSNEQDEEVEITLRNLTGRDWTVRLRDRVPYSEQEDLDITWEARPAPTETDVEGRRGVLEWRFDMAPGEDTEIVLTHRLRWPEDQVLR
ncbi:hypothetical protein OB2597_10966 [Pseudooceanicola batsensis HTCC2597]|uniref:DUF4139 domain-containing protein n=1 Tax=Pseudooceanicola batsensis (strain ATCC BAA-863 / DSM 15984 / KCTC 12145 / HTCC2597) TaxID=252305 RepID=A3TVW3_PSEBH|nr:mucoidy inhibitor MuiA family protein [Pseudooceanicola batsensis]EAQ03759.1 hypothetical protein OB2597_10966 [Pseudooceanicola batsensis HTCC2597]